MTDIMHTVGSRGWEPGGKERGSRGGGEADAATPVTAPPVSVRNAAPNLLSLKDA